MCLGKVGVVTNVWRENGVPIVRVDTGSAVETAHVLDPEGVEKGTNVLVHMGFVVEVLDPRSADEARRLRAEATQEEERA